MSGFRDDFVTILHGDAWTLAPTLEPSSVNCIVTSPPYWGLRDYGVPGQFGLEASPDEYVHNLVALFGELREALRDDGTVWLNLGDSYAADRGGTYMPAETLAGGVSGRGDGTAKRGRGDNGISRRDCRRYGLKHKDLVGIPWRVAFALQADGWYLRSDIIWHKPNPMPESVTDRPTKAHEYVFLLSKSERYWYDAEAIKEEGAGRTDTGRMTSTARLNQGGEWKRDKQRGHGRRHAGFNDRWDSMTRAEQTSLGRNKRSVWTVATQPFAAAHFATFPPDLIRPCILAGCPEGGTVLDPFMGSGTTAQVARSLGRKAIGFELNADYIEIAVKHRLAQGVLSFDNAGHPARMKA